MYTDIQCVECIIAVLNNCSEQGLLAIIIYFLLFMTFDPTLIVGEGYVIYTLYGEVC